MMTYSLLQASSCTFWVWTFLDDAVASFRQWRIIIGLWIWKNTYELHMRQLWLWLLDQKQRQLDVDGLPCSASHPGFLISQRRRGSVLHPHLPSFSYRFTLPLQDRQFQTPGGCGPAVLHERWGRREREPWWRESEQRFHVLKLIEYEANYSDASNLYLL